MSATAQPATHLEGISVVRVRGEIRQLVLGAAVRVFREHGYSASAKQIARRAGVQEALLFRTFGTKSLLFQQAIIQPFTVALRQFAEHWSSRDMAHPDEQRVRDLVGPLFEALSNRRDDALALAAAAEHADDMRVDAGTPLSETVLALERILSQEAARFDYKGLNPPVTARVGVGSVLATAMFRNWLFNGREADADDETIANELQTLLMHGVRNRPKP